MAIRAVLHRWFVQYNPLYVVSAMCVLAGAMLVARGLPSDAMRSHLLVTAVVQLYQFLLIGGAWLLVRAGQRRAAVLLGLAAFAFLFDVTLDGERLTSVAGWIWLQGRRARIAMSASACLAVLGVAKVALLARVFRLRGADALVRTSGAIVAALPLVPYLVEVAGPSSPARDAVYMALVWTGAIVLGWALLPSTRRWTSALVDGAWAATVRGRLGVALPLLVAGFVAGHGAAWSRFLSIPLSTAHAAPYLLVAGAAVTMRLVRVPAAAELAAWLTAALALAAGALGPPALPQAPLAITALLTAGVLAGLDRAARLRLPLPAIVCAAGGAYLLSTARAPSPWLFALAVALAVAALARRDFRCLFASACALGAGIVWLAPRTPIVVAPYAYVIAAGSLSALTWLAFPPLRRLSFVLVASILAVGAVLLGVDAGVNLAWYATTAVASLGTGVALHRRDFQVAGGSAGVPIAMFTRGEWMPVTAGDWGVALLAAGFLALIAGVLVNLLAARRPAPDV